MATLDLKEDVLDYINNKADRRFLKLVNALSKNYQTEKTNQSISVEQYNEELNTSISQIEKGEVYSHQEMGNRIRKWSEK